MKYKGESKRNVLKINVIFTLCRVILAQRFLMVVKNVFLSIVCIILLVDRAHAQQYSFSHLSVDDGLSQSSVYGMFQDSKGFLWFGTADGLNRYDGKTMKNYRSEGNEKLRGNGNFFGYNICEDKTGDLWFSGRDGLLKYDYIKDKIFRFFPNNDTTNFSKLIEILGVTPEQNLWFWSRGETIYCYNIINKKVTSYAIQDPTLFPHKHLYRSAKMDNKGTIWYTLKTGIGTYSIYTKKFNTYLIQYAQELALPKQETFVLEPIMFEPNGDILVSSGNSLLQFSPQKNRLTTIIKRTSSVAYFCGVKDGNGNTWVGTQNNGIFYYSDSDKIVKQLKQNKLNPSSIASNMVTNLFIDRSQNLWIGMDGKGLCKTDLKQPKFNHYFINKPMGWNFSTNFVKCIYVDDLNRIWIGTHDGGINVFDRTKNTVKVILEKELAKNTVSCFIKTPKGQLLVGGSAGVAYLNLETGSTSYIPFKEKVFIKPGLNLVYKMIFTIQGKLIVATRIGLFEGEERGGVITKIKKVESTGLSYFSSVYQTKDEQIWASTLESTYLYVLKYKNNKLEKVDSLLNGINVRCFYEDTIKNILWMASEKGLIKYDLRKKTHQNFNQSNGIANEYLYAILPDKKGFLWLSTNKGLSCFDPAKNTFVNYDNTDGLQSNEFNTGAYFSSEKGEFFFGGVNGFNSFFSNEIRNNFYKPKVVLTGFKIQDEEVSSSLGNSVLLSQISLPFYQNTVSFDFVALEFTHAEKNKYKYILEGIDNNWVNSEGKGFARYSGLKPGSYIFKVKGSNNDGIWSNEKILMQVIILSPWWTSWWFILLSSGLFILFITNIVRVIFAKKLREQQRVIEKQKAVEHERARISKDMHDDMGSGLSKIAIMSELLKTNLKEERETEQVEKISRTAKDLVDSMGQIVWAMNPENDTLENLTAYIRAYTVDFFDESFVECIFTFPDEINTIKLTQQQRRNIFLVIKESLNNILKYAESSEVQIQLFIQSKQLHLIICDNGKGFDISQTRRFGNGLINMKKRMEEVGGEYQIQSILNKGTTTTIYILL